jgi:dTDP-4-amino-4,6-dideoxygalactose transaminase
LSGPDAIALPRRTGDNRRAGVPEPDLKAGQPVERSGGPTRVAVVGDGCWRDLGVDAEDPPDPTPVHASGGGGMSAKESPAPVPFLDLPAQQARLGDELTAVWTAALGDGGLVGGARVEAFERAFAAYCGTSTCIGVGNGTDAIELILAGLGIGPGDEVIVPGNTYVSTIEAVITAGARPCFVDVDPSTLLIDPVAVEAAMSPATAAVIAVHLYGQMADIDALSRITKAHGVALIEDAAQAHGARFGTVQAGSAGVAASFSFSPGKNLGALGDGGAVTTNDLDLAERIRCLADHGRTAHDRHLHDLPGRDSRLDALQAGLLSVKLRCLDDDNRRRVAAMAAYRAGLPAACLPVATDVRAEPVYHLAVVQVDDRERIGSALTAAEIGWGLHYPVPCHQQAAFAEYGKEPLPVVEAAAGRVLSLPMSPTLAMKQIERVCDVLRSATAAA